MRRRSTWRLAWVSLGIGLLVLWASASTTSAAPLATPVDAAPAAQIDTPDEESEFPVSHKQGEDDEQTVVSSESDTSPGDAESAREDDPADALVRSLDVVMTGMESDEEVSCSQTSPGDSVLAAGEWIVFDCTNPDSPERGGEPPSYYFQLHSITEGWTWAYWQVDGASIGDPGSNPDGEWTSPPDHFASGPYNTTIGIALQPVAGQATSGAGSIQFEILGGAWYQNKGQSYDPPRIVTLSATYSEDPPSQPCELDVDVAPLSFSSPTWTDDSWPMALGEMPITVLTPDDSGCGNLPDEWALTVSAMPMSGPDGATIPPDVITIQPGPPLDGLTPVPGPVTLDHEARAIAHGAGPPPTAAWSVMVIIEPPDSAVPGAYEGTITIEINSAYPQ